jgi:O-antigen/teichoic acid export membrane protein
MRKLNKDISKLIAGRGLAFFFGIITALIITRLIVPADFGIFGIIESMGAWLGAFACFGYAQAIPLSRDRGKVKRLIQPYLSISLLPVMPLLSAPAFLGRFLADHIKGIGDHILLLWFIPVIFLVNSLLKISQFTLPIAA